MIYGWRCFKNPQTHFYQNITCPNCNAKGIFLQIYTRYFHIFWIPFFPLKKILQAHCQNCQRVFAIARMSSEMQNLALEAKENAKYPWYSFIGLMISACSIGISILLPALQH